jgi:hypothetical protein
LHRGNQLNLNVYSRAELRGSDHKPGLKNRAHFHPFPCLNFDTVFAIYDAEVRIIDRVKKAALSQILLESIITFLEPGEKLDKKFANLVLRPADPRQCMSFNHASFIKPLM